MKLYGGSRRSDNEPSKKPKVKKSLKRRKRILLFAATAAVILTGVVLFKTFIKPPAPVGPVSGNSNANNQQSEGEIPNIEELGKRKEGVFTFVVCGTDEDKTRTDTIIVATFDSKTKTMAMMNVPRDTLSNVKRNVRKINSAYAVGKIDELKKELTMLLGIPIDRYVAVDFDGFMELVDVVGGVEYDVPFRMKYDDPTQDLHIDLQPGLQMMDGAKAIQFMRFRQNNHGIKPTGYAEGDLGRIKAQQGFISALMKKLLSPASALKIGDITSAVMKNTETDFTNGEMLWLAGAGLTMDMDNISMHMLPGEAKTIYEPGIKLNQSYYIPKGKEILAMVNEYFNPYTEPVTKLNIIDLNDLASTSKKTSSSDTAAKTTETQTNGSTSEPSQKSTGG